MLRAAVRTRRPIRPIRPPARTVAARTRAGGQRTATPSAVRPTPPPAPPIVDYSSDPLLLQTRALSQRNLAGARAAALAARTGQLEQFGYDPALASLYPDANVAGAARANPNSVLAQLARANTQRVRGINEGASAHNLYYSSYRGQELGRNAAAYQSDQQTAAQTLRNALAGIGSSLTGVEQTEQERVMGAEQDAYLRALQYALANPTAGGAGIMRTATPAARNITALRGSLLRRRRP